jgi:AmmeMemoRadiSam system protein A
MSANDGSASPRGRVGGTEGAPRGEGRDSGAPALAAELGSVLVGLARASVHLAVREGRSLPTPAELPPALAEPRAAFVTLEVQGALRGCIGNLVPRSPLAATVIANARAAAERDPRFAPVVAEELERLDVEVSVLGLPTPLAFDAPEDLLRRLTPGRDGVILEVGDRRATFLPQVWDQLREPAAFLDRLAQKAGAGRDAWRGPGVAVSTYRVQVFHGPAAPRG